MSNKIFSLELTENHPIIKHHTVRGQALLPGMAYVDMLYQFACRGLELDFSRYTLNRLTIYNPLILDATFSGVVEFISSGDSWNISVRGGGKLFITAELHPGTLPLGEEIDARGMMKRASRKVDMEKIYAGARELGLVHSGVIKAKGQIYMTSPGSLVELKAVPSSLDRHMLFHPALIDSAGMAASLLVRSLQSGDAREALYLPLSFDTFYAAEPLGSHCYVKIDSASVSDVNEVSSFDLDFFNPRGRHIARLSRLTAKRVRSEDTSSGEFRTSFGPVSSDVPGNKEETTVLLKSIFASYLNKEVVQVDVNSGFFEMGLESSQLLGLVKDIEKAFGLTLSPSLLFEHNTLADLACFLEGELKTAGRSAPVPGEMNLSSGTGNLGSVDFLFSGNEDYLKDHLVMGRPALMGITHPCLVMEGYLKNNPGAFPLELGNIRFTGGPVGLTEEERVQISVNFGEGGDGRGFETLHRIEGSPERKSCCVGEYVGPSGASPWTMDISRMLEESKVIGEDKIDSFYTLVKDFQLGPMMKTISRAYGYDKWTYLCLADLTGKRGKGNLEKMIFDPLLLNSCYMLSDPGEAGAGLLDNLNRNLFVPLALDRIILFREMTEKAYIVKTIRSSKEDFVAFDALVLTESGEIIAEIQNATLKLVRTPGNLTNFSRVAPREEEEILPDEPIAIIGLDGRYPGARDLEEFYLNLKEGKDCISEVPRDRWKWEDFYDEEKNKLFSKWGGFIDGVDEFDPRFFNISPREAEFMDPQERLFIQCAYRTIEDAGYSRPVPGQESALGQNVGVFVGVMYEEYQLFAAQEQVKGRMFALGGNIASIANRVSYLFNLQGPSMGVDSMCSSSLTSIHLACQSLRAGECDAAIAGGVNLSIHPNKYILLSQGKFASPIGRCEAFGKGSGGYVPGEGVGAVLLKPLSRAERDGDHIYGVIRSSVLNAGGKTSGFTVPNPGAQAKLIKRAIEKAGINARSISYIEAHGTGTILGDPIEISGLTSAFSGYTEDKGFCAIGSVKSNVGHLESAAGIAGVTKILLQMKYGQLFPSLHSRTLNPNINFEETPFKVQQDLAPWESAGPRIAGISSLGAGGANAHIIFEEYISPADEGFTGDQGSVILLSARSEDGLKSRADALLKALEKDDYAEAHLPGIACTLLTGREVFEFRMGFLASSLDQVKEGLRAYLEGRKLPGLFRGRATGENETIALFSRDEVMRDALEKWVQRKEYAKVLELWVQGLEFHWSRLYKGRRPGRVSLPVYNFAKEKYWIEETPFVPGGGKHLHPLVHENVSDFTSQRYVSRFTGKEFFLADHKVRGKRILPAAVYLEMVRAAVAAAAGLEESESVSILNVVWLRPVVVDTAPFPVSIELVPGEEILFDINYEREDGTLITCSRGAARIVDGEEVPALDLEALRERAWSKELSPGECLEAFKHIGIEYGPGFRGIANLFVGEGEVLAKLELPESLRKEASGYFLHPSLVDAAFQSTLGLVLASDDKRGALPFALERIDILGPCTPESWAFLKSGGSAQEKKFDIDLCDPLGRVWARIRGLVSRVMEPLPAETGKQTAVGEESGMSGPPVEGIPGVILLEEGWRAQEIPAAESPEYLEHIVLLYEMGDLNPLEMEALVPGARFLEYGIKNHFPSISDRFISYARNLAAELGRILSGKPEGRILVQGLFRGDGDGALLKALGGILKTAGQENPRVVCQLVEVDREDDKEVLARLLRDNARDSRPGVVQWKEGIQYISVLKEVVPGGIEGLPWKEEGAYLLTGGVGGLGRIFAREIRSKCPGASIILTGRSPLDDDKRKFLEELNRTGGKALYLPVDVKVKKEVSGLFEQIEADFGTLNGIIHSAGVLRDSFLVKKSREESQVVLEPKVRGPVLLDEASREMKLDFFVLFSSTTGVMGNPGQAVYAGANAFMDEFARFRNVEVKAGRRSGKTLSLGWPLWDEGGIRMEEEARQLLKSRGMIPMETAKGVEVFYRSLGMNKDHLMVIEGEVELIRAKILHQANVSEPVKMPAPAAEVKKETPVEGLLDKTINFLKNIFSATLKIPQENLEGDTPFEKLGIDSILVMQLTDRMEKYFGTLSKTLLFEYTDINSLGEFFISAYPGKLGEILGASSLAGTGTSGITESRERKRKRANRFTPPGVKLKAASGDIAIIGVSGRYPGAADLGEFWENLKSGKDSISEVPRDRWDWREYSGESENKLLKPCSKWGGFLEDVDKFDPLFFNILPREARIIDPQERLFLECAYNTVEDAGYVSEDLGSRVGVFAGVMYEEYQLFGAQEQARGKRLAIGGSAASVANRVSFVMNLKGPSMAVDTMCSSSLTSIHLACQSLRNGECDAAIAGGVNLTIHPNKYLVLAQGSFVSSRGRCESFGKDGDGYIPGEGVGAVLLKPLSRAIEDRDHIYGVIKGSMLNAGGKTNGYTVPSPVAQSEVIGEALERAGVNPRDISYLEAHGTGTALGDPIEITGLTRAFRPHTQDKGFCSIGSVKSNIGHLESAAGIAAVTKVLLQLKHKKIVPSLHSKELNPNINFRETPFSVQQELEDWQSRGPRTAGISSFGAGGANAHIIIEEYIPQERTVPDSGEVVIALSARTGEALKARVSALYNHLAREDWGEEKLADLAYTLQVGRREMEVRLGFTASSMTGVKQKLKSFLQGGEDHVELYRGEIKSGKGTLSLLTSDEEMKEAISKWIEKKKYGKILELWVKGLSFDWHRLYRGKRPGRLSLPAYPFEKVRCWVTLSEEVPVALPEERKEDSFPGGSQSGNPFAF